MRTAKIDIPLEKMKVKLPCTVQLICHKNGSESLICRTTLENGKACKLIASLSLLPIKDCNGHEWFVSCSGMQTHSYINDRWKDAMLMFRFWLSVFTTVVRVEKIGKRHFKGS